MPSPNAFLILGARVTRWLQQGTFKLITFWALQRSTGFIWGLHTKIVFQLSLGKRNVGIPQHVQPGAAGTGSPGFEFCAHILQVLFPDNCCLVISISEVLCGMFLSLPHSHCEGASPLFYRWGGWGQNKCLMSLVFQAKILTLHTMNLPVLNVAKSPWSSDQLNNHQWNKERENRNAAGFIILFRNPRSHDRPIGQGIHLWATHPFSMQDRLGSQSGLSSRVHVGSTGSRGPWLTSGQGMVSLAQLR